MDYTDQDLTTLGEKLENLDLSDGEHAALVAIVEAADGEVAGFSMGMKPFGDFIKIGDPTGGNLKLGDPTGGNLKLGDPTGGNLKLGDPDIKH